MAVFPFMMKVWLVLVVTPSLLSGGGVTAQPFIGDEIYEQVPLNCQLKLDVAESCVLWKGNPCLTRVRNRFRSLTLPTPQTFANASNPCNELVKLNCRFLNACGNGQCEASFSEFFQCLSEEFAEIIGAGCGSATTIGNSTDVGNSTDSMDVGNSTDSMDVGNSTDSMGGSLGPNCGNITEISTCTIGPDLCCGPSVC